MSQYAHTTGERMNKTLLVGNWKMNLGIAASAELARDVRAASNHLENTEIWLAPSFPCITAVASALKGSSLKLGAQNVHWEVQGAFTGEVSAGMLRELGCEFVIVGHSERRHVFGETSEMVAKRCACALNSGFTTILCLGETLEEREQGQTKGVIESQLRQCLKSLKPDQLARLVIAYEPVWAIGTGKIAEPQQIDQAHSIIASHFPQAQPAIIYGGSVTAENFAGIVSLGSVAGALIGGASIDVKKFVPLIEIAER